MGERTVNGLILLMVMLYVDYVYHTFLPHGASATEAYITLAVVKQFLTLQSTTVTHTTVFLSSVSLRQIVRQQS